MTTDRILIDPGPSARGWHRAETFLRCPQLFAWKYRAHAGIGGGKSPLDEDRSALSLGSLIHVGLAHYYARLRERQNGRDADTYFTPSDAIHELGLRKGSTPELEEEARLVVDAYISHYAMEERHVRILHVEEVFEANFMGHPYTARVDLVFERAGKVYLVDHKSTQRIESRTVRSYSTSGQLIGYRWLGTAYGDRFGGVILNLLQAGKSPRFERPTLEPVPNLVAKFPALIDYAEKQIGALDAQDLHPSEWPAVPTEHTCFTRYGACPARERCRWGRDA
jgi:hypothetical protein